MIRRPPRSTQSRSSAASDVYKRQQQECLFLNTLIHCTFPHVALPIHSPSHLSNHFMLYNKLTAVVGLHSSTQKLYTSRHRTTRARQQASTARQRVHCIDRCSVLTAQAGEWKQRYGAGQPASTPPFHPPGRHRAADCAVRPITGPDVPYMLRGVGERTLPR